MKTVARLIVGILMALVFLAAGYWWASAKPVTPAAELASALEAAKSEGKGDKILYYRNPMGHPDTSPVPKKDPMGMDYLPVYEGEQHAPDSSVMNISPEKIQKLGVRTEIVALRELRRMSAACTR